MQKAIDALTNAAGTKGYAFAEVHPRLKRNPKTRTIDLGFEIVQGPRVYIEKINIAGNTRTLDKVIRRQFRLQEGDAFNRVLIDRSRTRIRGLGFFKDVDGQECARQPARPHQPDRRTCTEQSTGVAVGGPGLFLDHLAPGRSQLYRHPTGSAAARIPARVAAGLLYHQAGAVQLHRALFPGPRAGGGF